MPRIQANNIILYYEVSGKGQPVVFIHGLGSSTRDWEFQLPLFSGTYQVITYDLRGHGQSDKPTGPYKIPQFAADLAGLLCGLEIDAAHIVGISLGGCTAFQFAMDYPTMVKTLTIVNSVPVFNTDPLETRLEVERRVGIVQQLGMQVMGQALSEALFPKVDQENLRSRFIERWAENDPPAYIEATRSVLDWDVTDQLSSIHCPTLVISADNDIWPIEVKEAYVKLMSDAHLVVIPDAHHFVAVEQPERFYAALRTFLSQY